MNAKGDDGMNSYRIGRFFKKLWSFWPVYVWVLIFLTLRYLVLEENIYLLDVILVRPLVYFLTILSLLTLDVGMWVLDLLLALILGCAVFLITTISDHHEKRQYWIRPLIAMALFLALAKPFIGFVNMARDTVLHLSKAATYQKIQEEIGEADYALTWGSSHATATLARYVPELTEQGSSYYEDGRAVYYAKSAMLIDFDDPSITFCSFGDSGSTYTVHTAPLEETSTLPCPYDYNVVRYIDHRAYEIMYFYAKTPSTGDADDLLVAVSVKRLSDGATWVASDLIDRTTGKNYIRKTCPDKTFEVSTDLRAQ